MNMVYQVPTLRLSLRLSPIKGDSLCLPSFHSLKGHHE